MKDNNSNNTVEPFSPHPRGGVELVKKNNRVICAMSGGVDSSVAAALLKKQGYDVIGVFMKLWSENRSGLSTSFNSVQDRSLEVKENICCSAEAATAARAVANKLKIPFYVLNVEKEFKKAVVDYYIKEHESGRTPNPCVICNRDIKGEILMRKVLEFEADYLATGHYARLKAGNPKSKIQNPNDKQKSKCQNLNVKNYYLYSLREGGRKQTCLYQAKDKTKDQTYFLWMLTQKQLAKILFPVGDYTKSEVRKLAKKWQLPTAERRESQGVCFIPDRDIGGFLHRYAKKLTKPGEIVDVEGKKLGIHSGLVGYTIGQREHLGLGGPKAYYVVELKSKTNMLVVGAEYDLYRNSLSTDNLNWIIPNDQFLISNNQSNQKSKMPNDKIQAKIRYGHPAEKCQIEAIGKDKVRVIFQKPQRAITPGQSVVFYEDEEVLGGGVIK